MRVREFVAVAGIVARKILVSALVAAAATGAVAWLLGVRSLYGFGGALIWGGLIAIAVGAFSMSSARDIVADPSYQWQRSARRDGRDTHHAHAADRDYLDSRVVSFLQMLAAGAAVIALGELLKALAR